jgi:hypothetical protein
MDIVHHSHCHDINWLVDGPIGPFVDAFKKHLIGRRDAAHTFASNLRCIAHFAEWMRSRRLRLQRFGEASIQGAGIAHPVLAGAVTMRRLCEPRCLAAIGPAGSPSRHLCIVATCA